MDTIHKNNTNLIDKLFIAILNISLLTFIYFYGGITADDINLSFISLPLVVVATFIFHEYIHIFFFKVLSGGNADIKVIKEKDLGAVIMYQQNKDVLYTRLQTVIILVAPLVLITLLSIPLLNLGALGLIFKANMYLNIMGSSIDCALIFKLLRKYDGNIKVNYEYEQSNGVIMNIHNVNVEG